MSKQDRQGVRTPADIERKYDIGSLSSQSSNQSKRITRLDQALAQLEISMSARIKALEEKLSTAYPVGAVYVSVDGIDPSTIFEGEWELMSQGYLLVGLDQESEEEQTELQFLDKCCIWKRTA